MKTFIMAAACALLISGCASNPAGDPLQVRLNDMDSRLGNVERVVSNQSLVDLSRRIDALEAQQREQRGNLEVLQNTGEGARKAERDMYSDLDKRLSALETGARPVAGAGEPLAATAATAATGAAPGAGAG